MIWWIRDRIDWLRWKLFGPNYPKYQDDPAADERAAEADAPTAEPLVSAAELAAEDTGKPPA
jgi:hypothetical protein